MSKFWIFNAMSLGAVAFCVGVVRNERQAAEFRKERRERRQHGEEDDNA